jgi:transcriptional regulator with XRE-family HTH domain
MAEMPTDSTNSLPTVAELSMLELGATLRKVRVVRGFTGKALGKEAHMSQSKVSKIEIGRMVPTEHDIGQLIAVLQPDDATRAEILSQFDAIMLPDSEYRKIRQLGIAWKQREFQRREASARIIRVFELLVVPGLMLASCRPRTTHVRCSLNLNLICREKDWPRRLKLECADKGFCGRLAVRSSSCYSRMHSILFIHRSTITWRS